MPNYPPFAYTLIVLGKSQESLKSWSCFTHTSRNKHLRTLDSPLDWKVYSIHVNGEMSHRDDQLMKAESMFKIREFSQLGQVSVKTLRYYDQLGVLKPAQSQAKCEERDYR